MSQPDQGADTAPVQQTDPVELLVCVKCRRGTEIPEDGERPGQALFDALAQRDLPDGVTLHPVECLQNCDQGCSAAMRGGADRWTYLYGNLHETSHLDLLVEGAALYRDTKDGLIPWRTRPDHFKRNCIARIPPLAATAPASAAAEPNEA
jgi:predicted metal-binding protein